MLILLVCAPAFDDCLKSDILTPVTSEACFSKCSLNVSAKLLVLAVIALPASLRHQVGSEQNHFLKKMPLC